MSNAASKQDIIAPPTNPRRAATRARICDCANRLFFELGFASVTMEQIAQAAEIRRSTLYLHFSEKDEILAAIAEDYTARLRKVIARLPGPVPTRVQIAAWVAEFAEFVAGTRASTELLVSLSHLPKAPEAAVAFGQELKAMMAEQVAAFRTAQEPGQHMALARSITVMDGLGWALCHHARAGGDDLSRARLEVAVESLNQFVRGDY